MAKCKDKELLANLFFNVYMNKNKKHIIDNVYDMKHKTKLNIVIEDALKLQDILKLRFLQFKVVNKFIEIFKLKNCQDTKTAILKKTIDEEGIDYIINNYDKITTAFGFAKNETIKRMIKKEVVETGIKGQAIFYLINNIFNDFAGMTLKVDKKEKNSSNSTISYKLKGLCFYKFI